MKTVFSGIQPTGKVHLGNLLGAINNWVHLSNEENKNYFCVVDLHSLTTHPDPSLMQENINETIKVLISSGINQKILTFTSKVMFLSMYNFLGSYQTFAKLESCNE